MDEKERFSELFRSSYPRLHRYARHRGLTGADADDLVAATFEIAWRRMEDVPVGDPAPWLFAVARNLWRNKRRAEKRGRTLLERLDTGMVQADAEDPVAGHDVGAVTAALRRLREDDRELLVLVAWDGLSPSQAAVVLGCSPAVARTRLHRARRRFAALVAAGRDVQRAIPVGQGRVVPMMTFKEAGDG
jgi:RNA polymerase sigma-70 factor, ECF subfamily